MHECLSFSVIAKADFCNNVLLQIFSLVESCFIEIRVLLSVTLQKELKLVLCVFPEQILFRDVLKPSQTSKMEFIAKVTLYLWIFWLFALKLKCLAEFWIIFLTIVNEMATLLWIYFVKSVINQWYKEVVPFSINLFIVSNNKTRALSD